MSDLASHSVPAPAVASGTRPPHDRWLLYLPSEPLRDAWSTAASDPFLPLQLALRSSCALALQTPRVSLPSRALANDNVHVPLPLPLCDLTPAELLFIARGHTHCRLITLPTRGSPETHQRALRGNVISFPQNSASLLSALPASVDSVSDLLTVFFPPEQNLQPNRCPEFVVRRSRVRDAILWLQTHNPYYADVTLDTEALASLPDHGIPHSLLHAARVLPEATVSIDPGPADAVPDDLLAPSLPTALHAAVLDVEREATHPIARWQQALVARDAATESLTVSDPDPVLAASRVTSALDAARALGDLSASINQPAPDSQSAYAVVPHGSSPECLQPCSLDLVFSTSVSIW